VENVTLHLALPPAIFADAITATRGGIDGRKSSIRRAIVRQKSRIPDRGELRCRHDMLTRVGLAIFWPIGYKETSC